MHINRNELSCFTKNNNARHKRQQFHQEIRCEQIRNMKQQIRTQCMHPKITVDYLTLKSINLIETIRQFKFSSDEESVHEMLLYSSSQQMKDHLYDLFDQEVLSGLCGLLRQPKARTSYNHKILWILSNYTAFCTQAIPKQLIHEFYLLAKQQGVGSNTNINDQFLECQVLSFANMLSTSTSCRQIMTERTQYAYIMLRSYLLAIPNLERALQQNLEPELLIYYCNMLQNLFESLSYYELFEDLRDPLISNLAHVLTLLIERQQKMVARKHHNLQLIILQTFRQLLINSHKQNSQVLFCFESAIVCLSKPFQNLIQTKKITPYCKLIISLYVDWLDAIYWILIPEQNSNRYVAFFCWFFESHVGDFLQDILKLPESALHLAVLKMLKNIMLDEDLTEKILMHNIFLISQIFKHANGLSFKHCKQAVICLVNLIKSTVYLESSTKSLTLETLRPDNFIEFLGVMTWKYHDAELNIAIVEGMMILVEYEQELGTHQAWIEYASKGGKQNLQKMVDQTENSQLKALGWKLLDMEQDLDFDQHQL